MGLYTDNRLADTRCIIGSVWPDSKHNRFTPAIGGLLQDPLPDVSPIIRAQRTAIKCKYE